MSISTTLTRVIQWREAGPIVRDLLKEGHKELSSKTELMTEIILREHTAGEMPWHAHYFIHYLPKDFAAGVARVEQAGSIGKITDLAIKSRFQGKGHEERMIDLLEKSVIERGIKRLEVSTQSPVLTPHLLRLGYVSGPYFIKQLI